MRRVSELEDIQHREAISRKAPQFRKMITMPKKKKRVYNHSELKSSSALPKRNLMSRKRHFKLKPRRKCKTGEINVNSVFI